MTRLADSNPSSNPEAAAARFRERRFYCVMCGVDKTKRNGLQTCPKSEAKQPHLWAVIGVVMDWFPVKRTA